MLSENELPMTQDEDSKRSKQAFVFCCLILFVNVSAFLIIITSNRLRRKSKFQIVGNICLLNITSCLIYFPLSVHQHLHSHYRIGTYTLSFLQTTANFVSPSITGFSLTVLGAEHLWNRSQSLLDSKSTLLVSIVGIVLPWMYGVVAYWPCLYQQLAIGEALQRQALIIIHQHNLPSNYSSSSSFAANEPPSTANEPPSTAHEPPSTAHEPPSTAHDTSLPSVVDQFSLATIIGLWGVLPILAVLGVTLCSCFPQCSKQSQPEVDHIVAMETWQEGGDRRRSSSRPQQQMHPGCTLEIHITTLIYVLGNSPFLYDLVANVLSCDSTTRVCVISRPIDYTFALGRWVVAFILPAVWLMDAQVREALVDAFARLCSGFCVAAI